mgnify:FL=1
MINNKETTIIILAAGKGTRMNSTLPKVLHELNNKSLIMHVIDCAKKILPKKIIVIVGYQKDLVINNLKDESLTFVEQKDQLGTGHAIKMCLPSLIDFNGNVLILSGDVPLIKNSTLNSFINTHNENNCLASLITTDLINPTGYGRIIKENNNFEKIVEEKDTNNTEKKISEINSGIYIFDSKVLKEKIPLIKSNNAQQEFYLTDIFNFIDKNRISTFKTEDESEISGINTSTQLKELENQCTK